MGRSEKCIKGGVEKVKSYKPAPAFTANNCAHQDVSLDIDREQMTSLEDTKNYFCNSNRIGKMKIG
eukprot:583477-Pelagomonas_calceolata.AAC.1